MADQDRPGIADNSNVSVASSSTHNSDNYSQASNQNSIQNGNQNNQMADKWKSKPLQGNFNPGSKLGKDIFLEKIKGLPESQHLNLTRTNAHQIHQFF